MCTVKRAGCTTNAGDGDAAASPPRLGRPSPPPPPRTPRMFSAFSGKLLLVLPTRLPKVPQVNTRTYRDMVFVGILPVQAPGRYIPLMGSTMRAHNHVVVVQ
jgi:hypothetical protein